MNIIQPKAILYVERAGLQYFAEGGIKTFSMPYHSNIVADLEVLNKDEFIKQIKEFITENKFISADVLIILSESVLFEKKLGIVSKEVLDKEKQTFLDNMPFDNVTMRHYVWEKTIRLVGVNKDFYQDIKQSFIEKGFPVRGIIPYLILEPFTKKSEFDLVLAKLILKKFGYLKQLKFLIQQPEANDFKLFIPSSDKPQTSYLPILVPFLIILGVLFIFLFMYQARQKFTFYPQNYNLLINPNRKSQTNILTSTASASFKADVVLVKIVGQTSKTPEIKKLLESLGLKNITDETNNKTVPEKTAISFSSKVPRDVRNKIMEKISTIILNIVETESKDMKEDLVITIGQ